MTSFDSLPDLRDCAFCRKSSVYYDYELEEYFLFKYSTRRYAHAECLFINIGGRLLQRIPRHTWKDFLIRLRESSWSRGTVVERQTRRDVLRILKAVVKQSAVPA